jgi:hypothetical protein
MPPVATTGSTKAPSLCQPGYDFFIAHSGKDTRIAERLFDLLAQDTRVFLDSRCLKYGDHWDVVLPRARNVNRL